MTSASPNRSQQQYTHAMSRHIRCILCHGIILWFGFSISLNWWLWFHTDISHDTNTVLRHLWVRPLKQWTIFFWIPFSDTDLPAHRANNSTVTKLRCRRRRRRCRHVVYRRALLILRAQCSKHTWATTNWPCVPLQVQILMYPEDDLQRRVQVLQALPATV